MTVLEGFHYLHHPVTRRLHELLDSGELGDLRHVDVETTIPAPADDDPRWSLALAGGALMDLGCYSLHAHRMLALGAAARPGWSLRAAGSESTDPESTSGSRPSLSSRPGRRDARTATWPALSGA